MYALVALEVQADGTLEIGVKMAQGSTPDAAKANFMLQSNMDPSDFARYLPEWCEANNLQLLCIEV